MTAPNYRKCPFCSGRVDIVKVRDFGAAAASNFPPDVDLDGSAVVHTVPVCAQFDEKSALQLADEIEADMADKEGERAFVQCLLDGVKELVQALEREKLPGGRRLIFMAMAGCRLPDGTIDVQLLCNAGPAGLDSLLAQIINKATKPTPWN